MEDEAAVSETPEVQPAKEGQPRQVFFEDAADQQGVEDLPEAAPIVEPEETPPPTEVEQEAAPEAPPLAPAPTAEQEELAALRDIRDVAFGDPEARKALLAAARRRNPNLQLTPEDEALIAPPKPAGPTRKEALAHVENLKIQGRYEEAQSFYDQHILGPELDARIEKRQKESDEKVQRENIQRTVREQTRSEWAETAKTFKGLLIPNEKSPTGFDWVQTKEAQEVAEKADELSRLSGHQFPIQRSVKLALLELGRYGKNPNQPAQQTRTATAPQRTHTGMVPPPETKGRRVFYEERNREAERGFLG